MGKTDLEIIMEKLKSLDSIHQDIKKIHNDISELSHNVKTLEYQMDIVGNQPNDGFVNTGFRKAFSKAAVIGASRQVNPSYMR